MIARKILARVVANMGPPPAPVRFRADLVDAQHWAITTMRAHGFLIRLDRGLCELVVPGSAIGPSLARAVLQDTVIHELAHAYAWNDGAAYRGDHDEVWGIMHARIYCAATGGH